MNQNQKLKTKMLPTKIEVNKFKPGRGEWKGRYGRARDRITGEIGKMIIDDYSSIKTESQLAYHLLKHFGTGRFQLVGHRKKHEGIIMFFICDIERSRYKREMFRKDKASGREVEINWQDDSSVMRDPETVLKEFGVDEMSDEYEERLANIERIQLKGLKNEFHGWGFFGSILPVKVVGEWHLYSDKPIGEKERFEEDVEDIREKEQRLRGVPEIKREVGAEESEAPDYRAW